MGDIAIHARGLGKRYRIGKARKSFNTLRDALTNSAASVARRLQRKDATSTTDTIWALRDVSFDVRRGEVLGIIGRNGAGKSTLLKILSRITEPTCGEVDIYGRVGALLEVGTGFHPELTGRENVYLNGAILGMRRQEIRRKFDEIVDFSGIQQFIDTPAKYYSTGMYMRLAFAVAAHLEPEILLVDEVLAVGDAEFQQKCLGKMGEVAREGRTVLFVSHNMGAVTSMCSRGALLDHGRLASTGEIEAVVRLYLDDLRAQPAIRSLAEGAGPARFTKLAAIDLNGKPTSQFDVRQPVTILAEMKLAQNVPGLQVSLEVFNARHDRVFYSSSFYSEPSMLVEKQGTHLISAQIPSRFLTPGRYTASLALHRPHIDLYDLQQDALHFDVIETGSGRQEFAGQDIGVVFVDVKWELLDPTHDVVRQLPA